ncbi:MAG: hypothetical protein ACXWKP_32765, partial [Bradyrhizobium sp.]
MTRQRSSGRKSSLSITSPWEACYAPAPRVPPISRRQWRMVGIIMTLLAVFGLLFVAVSSKPALSQGVQLVKVDVS